MTTPETRGNETATALRKGLKWLAIATVVLYVGSIIWGIKVWQDGQDTNAALCAYRISLEDQVLASTQFLQLHPTGTPDIPAKVIVDGIARQQRAIDSLHSLSCPEPTT